MPEGMATTFAVENHEGMLYNLSPTDTKFFSMLGGLFGGEPLGSIVIPWQEYALRNVANRARIEGDDHPTPTHVTRDPVHNVLQVVHETIDTSWTKRATQAMLAAIGSNHPNIATAGLANPAGDEHDWQQSQQMKEIVRDCEHILLNGDFVEPADDQSARQTRGIIAATVTNHVDLAGTEDATQSGSSSSDDVIAATAHGLSNGDKIQFTALTGGAGLETNVTYYVVNAATNTFQVSTSAGGEPVDFTTDIASGTFEPVADVAEDDVIGLLQTVWDNGGIQEEETAVLLVNSWNKRQLTDILITQKNYREMSRSIAGVHVTTFESDFGTLNIVLDRFMPKNTIQVVSMEECNLGFLILDDGTKVRIVDVDSGGSRDRTVVYFEFGLRYGNELRHGKLTGLATR